MLRSGDFTKEDRLLTEYVQAALRRAKYEILEDGTFYGEIPGFDGVYANAETLDECREDLRQVLEGWIVLGLRLNHVLPTVDGISLSIEKVTP
jgi:predicted RNase H-like HicB family nuclease